MFKKTNWIFECKDTTDIIKNHMDELELGKFSDKTIQKIVAYAISVYGTQEELELSEKAADIVSQMMAQYKFITATTRLAWVDYTIAGVYLHNLFTDENDWTSVFDARKELTPVFEKEKVPEQVYTQIFKLVEAQYGEFMPVEMCRPVKNSPAELFFWAIWFARQLIAQEQQDECVVEEYLSDGPTKASVITEK